MGFHSRLGRTSAGLCVVFAALSSAAAQTQILGVPAVSADGHECSMLPGSPPIEGRPFVVALRGVPGAQAVVSIHGEERDFAWNGLSQRSVGTVGTSKLSVDLDAEGRGSFTLDGWRAGSELAIEAYVVAPHSTTTWKTQSLLVRPFPAALVPSSSSASSSMPPPGGTSVTPVGAHSSIDPQPINPVGPPVVPSTAALGATISVAGPQLSILAGRQPKDVRVVNPSLRGCIARVDTVGVNALTATLTDGSPFPVAAPLQVQVGNGVFTNVPTFAGMVYTTPAWSWKAAPGIPPVNTDNFRSDAQTVFQPCSDPDMFVDQRFRVEGGVLKVALPGAKGCKGDVFNMKVGFTLSDGNSYVVNPVTGALATATNWQVDSPFLLWPLFIALLAQNTGCTASFNAVPPEIWITAPTPLTVTSCEAISALHILFDPAEHVIVTETHGVDDNYSTTNGPELTMPSVALDNWVLAHYSVPARREYDNQTCDRWLRDTFSNYGPGANGAVRTGKVQIHMRAFGCQTYTDHIVIGFALASTSVFDWSPRLEMLAALTFGWLPGDDATLCFDLAQLPVMSLSNQLVGLRNVIDRANENHLDIAVDDDTTVDYITVKVLRCRMP